MPEEVGFFGRTAVYGVLIAIAYWFVSYEVTGTVLLAGFGLATGVGFALLWRRHRTARRSAGGVDPDRPFTDETGPVPLRSFAPLELGIGVAVLGLGLVFGIWFIVAAAAPLALGALHWVGEARGELDLRATGERPGLSPADGPAITATSTPERPEPPEA